VLTPKKNITKREIKEDKLVTFYYKAVAFADKYQKQLMVGALVVVLIGVGIFFYINNRNKNNELASNALSKVIGVYESGRYNEAITGIKGANKDESLVGLQEIVSKYGNSENGDIAKLYLANAYYSTGKFDEALKNYKDCSGSNPVHKAAAISGQAACSEAKENYIEAAEYFEKASFVDGNNTNNPDYLLKAGINYIKVNKKEKAKELLEKIKKDYASSGAMKEVERYLAQVE